VPAHTAQAPEAVQHAPEAAAALEAAVATAQWVDTTAAAPAEAAAPDADPEAAALEVHTPGPDAPADQQQSPYRRESAFQPAAQQGSPLHLAEHMQTPAAGLNPNSQPQQTPGTEYYTPAGGEAAAAARGGVPGPLGHMASLGAWLALGASSHASDTTGGAFFLFLPQPVLNVPHTGVWAVVGCFDCSPTPRHGDMQIGMEVCLRH